MNVNESEYVRGTQGTGLHLIVDKHNQTVSSDASGFAIPMGLHTSLSLRYVSEKLFHKPMSSVHM